MKKYILLFILPALFACKAIKTVKIFKKGEVAPSEFKAEIPFERRLELIILKIEIKGKMYDFVLDTGAPNVISTELASELNIKSTVSNKAVDSEGKKADLGFAEIPDLAIGGIHFTNTGTAIADLSQTEIGCLGIDGFIGANLMRKAIWHLDYQRNVITITHSKSNLSIPADAKIIPFKSKLTGTPLIAISYNGITEENITFDLGSNGGFSSSNNILTQVEAKTKINTVYGVGNNVSGLFGLSTNDTITYGVVPTVKLGNLELGNQVVSFSENKGKIVGTDLFENYHVIFDWEKEEITMIPVKPFLNAELKAFGLSPTFKENKLYVGFIYEGSDAQALGIVLGDQILQFNEKDYRNCSNDQWCDIMENGYLKQGGSGTVVLLKNGEEKTYTLGKTTILK